MLNAIGREFIFATGHDSFRSVSRNCIEKSLDSLFVTFLQLYFYRIGEITQLPFRDILSAKSLFFRRNLFLRHRTGRTEISGSDVFNVSTTLTLVLLISSVRSDLVDITKMRNICNWDSVVVNFGQLPDLKVWSSVREYFSVIKETAKSSKLCFVKDKICGNHSQRVKNLFFSDICNCPNEREGAARVASFFEKGKSVCRLDACTFSLQASL